MKPPMSATRRRFLQFLASVAAVHVVALALYYALQIEQSPEPRQQAFAWTWMAVTVLVVVIGLQRLKRARRADRGVPRR
jgi:hypothetical protein